MGERIVVVDPREVAPTEPASGLARWTAFRRGGYRQDRFRVDGNDRTAWHRHGGALFGWVRAGSGRIEYGPEGTRAAELASGDFLHVPPGVVARYVTDADPLELFAVTDAGTGVLEAGRPAANDGTGRPTVVEPDGLVAAVESADLIRETPFPDVDAGVLLLRVRAAGGAEAGWHHHGDNVYFGYAVDGPSETEYGPNGDDVARIGVGECFHVPPGLVHRDTNPTDETHTGIIWLCGSEPWVVNVDGPQ